MLAPTSREVDAIGASGIAATPPGLPVPKFGMFVPRAGPTAFGKMGMRAIRDSMERGARYTERSTGQVDLLVWGSVALPSFLSLLSMNSGARCCLFFLMVGARKEDPRRQQRDEGGILRKKERKQTTQGRDGRTARRTPPPHRDFKERCVMR